MWTTWPGPLLTQATQVISAVGAFCSRWSISLSLKLIKRITIRIDADDHISLYYPNRTLSESDFWWKCSVYFVAIAMISDDHYGLVRNHHCRNGTSGATMSLWVSTAMRTLHGTPYRSYIRDWWDMRIYFIYHYNICQIKCGGCGGRKQALTHIRFQWTLQCELMMNTLIISAKSLIQIGSLVTEIRPGKSKVRGHVYLSKRIYSTKYVISLMVQSIINYHDQKPWCHLTEHGQNHKLTW